MKRKLIFFFISLLTSFILLFFGNAYTFQRQSLFQQVPAPTLLYPVTNNINLRNKDFLEFRWERGIENRVSHYVFRLYNGIQTQESSLIIRLEVESGVFPIQVPAEEFQENQTYTWSLQRVAYGGLKSDRSYSSFKIIAK